MNPLRTLVLALLPVAFLIFDVRVVAQGFVERAKAQGVSTAAGDQLGSSIAIDGRRTVVGGVPSTGAPGVGKAHVFGGCSGIVETQELIPGDGFVSDRFGESVAIDGDRVVVGAPQIGLGNGAAYVFHHDGTRWILEQKLTAGDGALDDWYGRSVGILDDLVVVGAPGHAAGVGAVYLYRRTGLAWTQEQKLDGFGVSNNRFGESVSLDGEELAVGASNYSGSWLYTRTGAAILYRHNSGVWSRTSTVVPTNQFNALAGYDVVLQGNRLLVSAPRADDLPRTDCGVVYAYERSGTGYFNQIQSITPASAATGEFSGYRIALDGDTAIVSAFRHDAGAVDAGAAFVYRFDGAQWIEAQTLTTGDAQPGDNLWAVALSGGHVAIGVLGQDDAGVNAGSVYVFSDPFRTYGVGVAGTGAVVPTLTPVGIAAPGATVTLEVRDFVGGASGVVLVGFRPAHLPFFTGRLLVDSTFNSWAGGIQLPGGVGVAGVGDLDVSLAIPNHPSFSCMNLYAQAFALDPGIPSNVTMTNAGHIFVE